MGSDVRALLSLLIAPLLCGGCFSLLTDSDGIAGGGVRDTGGAGDAADAAADAYIDPAPKAEYEKRYTELLGKLVGTTTSPLPTGLTGVAQGVTFPANGKLVALFGDNFLQYDDAVGFAPTVLPASGVPAITWLTNASGFVPLKVPTVDLGRGNVPVEGLVVAEKTYVFFATGYNPGSGRYGGGALAHTTTDLASLSLDFVSTTSKFVHVSVVQDGGTAWIYGAGPDYKRSPIHLAKATVATIADRTKWSYYTPSGFVADEASAKPLVDHDCVGELSVRKHPRLGLYLMAYACGVPRGVLVRFARKPEGPWSSSVNVMDSSLADGGYGRTMHATFGVAGHDDGLSEAHTRAEEAGSEYGAYLVPEWFDAQKTPDKTFAIVYTMSTFNPYTVWLMRTVLGEPRTTAAPATKGVGLPKATLANGDFKSGLSGWTATGSIRVYGFSGKVRVTTSGQFTGDSATGTLSQEFTVDSTTSRLEFLIHGGDASVKLLRGTEVVRQSWGRRSNDDSKVVWDLQDLRGEKVKILIEDTLSGPWGFVGATEFTLK